MSLQETKVVYVIRKKSNENHVLNKTVHDYYTKLFNGISYVIVK